MSDLLNTLARACAALGLTVENDRVVEIPGGPPLLPLARIPSLGAPNGMLIFRNYDDVRPRAEDLLLANYAYSVLDEPRSGELFDIESFKEMFADWGWSGDPLSRPVWMAP